MSQHAASPLRLPTGRTTVSPAFGVVNRSLGHTLDRTIRAFMESRFLHDFTQVRVHDDPRAAASAGAVNALAYTVGSDIVFAARQYRPMTSEGRSLIAHELAHVVQQASSQRGRSGRTSHTSTAEYDADAAAEAALAGRPVHVTARVPTGLQRRAAPYISKIKVHLSPPQKGELEWQGTPPDDATGSDSFAVSTGKGYGDPEDPPGTCSRKCCSNPMTQCAPPWNRPNKVGACCTYYGSDFWTGVPEERPSGWKWWTPIQPWYSTRSIALHSHPEVTGQPIGHGCVRMEEPNAKRIYDYSNRRRTSVIIDGRAAPVACAEDRKCEAERRTSNETDTVPQEERLADLESAVVPGLEGIMS